MTRQDIAEHVRLKLPGLTQPQAGVAVDAVIDAVKDGLIEDGSVILRGFGAWHTRYKDGRWAWNPKTGERAWCTPRQVVVFKASTQLKSRLNGGDGGRNVLARSAS